MTNEDRQKFLQTIPGMEQSTNLTQDEVIASFGRKEIEKITLEKQLTIVLDQLMEVTKTNEHLRQTLESLQEKSKPPK
jgi:hypothetical protein